MSYDADRHRAVCRAEAVVRNLKREVWLAERKVIELHENVTLCKCNADTLHRNDDCPCARPILRDAQPGCMERACGGELCVDCAEYRR